MVIKPRLAAKIALGLLILAISYHISILTGIVPMEMTWGGKISTFNELLVFESISIFINLLIAGFLFAYLQVILWPISPGRFRIIFRALGVLFALNTIGNLVSENELEKMIFTPMTMICTYLFWNLSKE